MGLPFPGVGVGGQLVDSGGHSVGCGAYVCVSCCRGVDLGWDCVLVAYRVPGFGAVLNFNYLLCRK